MQLVIVRFNLEISWVKRVKMVKKTMKTDINGHRRSWMVKKVGLKNVNGESRSALNGNGSGANQKKYCKIFN